jgi:hypothetical protein
MLTGPCAQTSDVDAHITAKNQCRNFIGWVMSGLLFELTAYS